MHKNFFSFGPMSFIKADTRMRIIIRLKKIHSIFLSSAPAHLVALKYDPRICLADFRNFRRTFATTELKRKCCK